ncbi:hypothetical protein KIN20_008268 [Parelaphostrongylus tenuis]|uniref:Uncharacterized protein n=1 Tax=Parelaphostrongylus tenuis TaxID=148309 RepID=A0AAD5QHD1_PARTN|nr:hypothetical protein KIN20_008268 [Parelaphostrongylus tenuis]
MQGVSSSRPRNDADDDGMYRRRRYSSSEKFTSSKVFSYSTHYPSRPIVQEVAISYSAPLTVSAPSSPMSLPLHTFDLTIDEHSSIRDYPSDQRFHQARVITPESVERVNALGRHETEFPVRVAYVGGESVSPPHSTLPSTFREPIVDSRASTRLAGSVVSETTTIQELTTITTTSHGRSGSSSEMPGVTELTQRFERGSRSDSSERGRSSQQRPSSRVVVVSKPGPEFFYSSDESRVRRVERPSYSPSDEKSVLSTTVVDIDPSSYQTTSPRYVEERYQMEEQYRSVKSYTSPTESSYKPKEIFTPTIDKKETAKESFTGHTVFSSRDQQYEQELSETYASTPVRSVVEQFESKIEEGRRTPEKRPYQFKEKFEEISVREQRGAQDDYRDREVFIPKSDLRPSRKTYTESITTSRTTIGPEGEQPFRGRREITREEVERLPPYQVTKTEELPSYRKMKEIRREEVDETQSRIGRRTVSPPLTKSKEEKKDVMEEIVTTDVRKFPRVEIPKRRSPSPPRVIKSTTEITKEELKEEKRKVSDDRPRDFHTTSTDFYDYEKTEKMDDTKTRTRKRYAESDMPSLYQEEQQHYTRRSGGLGPRTQPSGMAYTGTNEFVSGSSVTASEIREIREREKREMRGLNDRLAAYIEQVRFLEAQNRKLNHDLERLTKGKHAPGIRSMYETEIKQSQSIIADAKKDYGNLEKEVRGLSADLTDIRSRYDAAVKARNLGDEDDLIVKLCDLQAQICMTKRRNAVIDEECKRIREENHKLNSDLAAQRQLLEKETLQRMNYEHQAQALIEECKVITSSNSVKLDKYKYQDTTEENRAIFRQGLSEAIAEIRKLYDEDTSKFRSEMENWYSKQVIEIRTGARHAADPSITKEKVKALRAQLTEMRTNLANLEGRNHILEKLIQDLNFQIEDESRVTMAHLSEKDDEIRAIRSQCQAITLELEKLIVEKVKLDAEISKYRQLLEGEESRTHGRIISTASHSFDTSPLPSLQVRSTTTATAMRRVTTGPSRFEAQRSAQGNVSIADVASDGSFITIENTSVSHDEKIGEWKLRSTSAGRDISFIFPRDFILTPKSKTTVYARGKGFHAPPHSLVFEAEESFVTGGDVHVILYNEENQERASFIQRSAGL